jgi:endonuclease YncB( thermonuclease family)
MPKQSLAVKSYSTLLSQLKKVFIEGLQRIEEEKVRTYWRTGELISNYLLENKERADYGENLLSRLSGDLTIDRSTLQRSVQFYRTYPIFGARHKLTWMHYRKLITIEDKTKRELFEERAVKKEWSSQELFEAIRLDRLELEEPEEKPAASDYKLPVTRSRIFAYRILEPSYINATEETVVVDVGFYINAQVALKGIARPKDGQIVESLKSGSSYTFKTSDAKPRELYTYKALVERVVDGDTLWVNIDCGFDIWIRQKLRLRGIDCPELSTEKGQEAKKFVEAELKELKFIVIKTHSSDKYDRYLADIFYLGDVTDPQDVLAEGTFLNQELLDRGFAGIMRD